MSKKKGQKYFIFNINTSEVSGAIVFFDQQSKKPFIKYASKKNIFVEENDSLVNFKKSTANALRESCEDLFKYINTSGDVLDIEETFVFMTSPWVKKNIETLVEERIKPFAVTSKFLEEFISYERTKDKKERLVNSEIISVKANGYNVLLGDTAGKDISKLEVSLIDSYIKRENESFVSEIIKEKFSLMNINIMPFLPVLFSQIRKIYGTDEDFAFMDFTGEIMEFGIFKDNNIKSIISVQTGKNKIIRNLVSNGIANSVSEGEYIFSLYLRKNLEKSKVKKVKEIVDIHANKTKEEILKELKKYNIFEIPRKVFVISSGEMNFIVEDMNIFEENHFIGKSFLKNFVEVSDDKYFNNFLALESEYIFE